MSKLTADLQFSVRPENATPGGTPFDLVEEPEDQTYLRKALYQPFMSWAALAALGNGKYGEALPLSRYGVIHLRVYCPESVVPELIPLDPLDQQEQLLFAAFLLIISVGPSGYNGKQVEKVGRARADRIERITFNGENRASIKYTYDPGQITILYQTQFLDKDGNPAPAPVLNSKGEFIADREIYGALTVRYQPSYWRFKVFYDLSGFGVDVEVRGLGYQAVIDKRRPPLPIMARYNELSDLQEFTRDVEEWDFGQINTGSEDFDGTEQAGQTVNQTQRITNPLDPQDYVDVERPEILVFKDTKGRIVKLKRVV